MDNFPTGTVSVFATATNSWLQTIFLGNTPIGIAASPNGLVYVANQGDGTVSVIDKSNKVLHTITVGNTPLGVAFSTAGDYVWVVNEGDGSTSVINTATDNKGVHR